jgi:hypothetical protein
MRAYAEVLSVVLGSLVSMFAVAFLLVGVLLALHVHVSIPVQL